MEKRYNLRNDPKPTLYNPHPTHRHTRDSEPLANDTPHTPHTDNTTTPHDSPVDSEGSQEDMMSTHDDDQTIDERAEEDDVPDQSAEDGERTTEEMPNGRRDDEQRRTEQEKETRPIDPVLLRIMAGIENLTQKQQEMSHNMDGLKENMDKNKEEVKQSMDKNKEEMKQSMDKKLDRNKHEIKEDIGELRQEMNSMMERHIKELKKEMKEEIKKSEHKMMQKVEDVHDRMTSMVGEVSEMKQQAYKTKEQVDRHEDKIEELRLHANSVTSNINDLKENMVEIKDQSDKQNESETEIDQETETETGKKTEMERQAEMEMERQLKNETSIRTENETSTKGAETMLYTETDVQSNTTSLLRNVRQNDEVEEMDTRNGKEKGAAIYYKLKHYHRTQTITTSELLKTTPDDHLLLDMSRRHSLAVRQLNSLRHQINTDRGCNCNIHDGRQHHQRTRVEGVTVARKPRQRRRRQEAPRTPGGKRRYYQQPSRQCQHDRHQLQYNHLISRRPRDSCLHCFEWRPRWKRKQNKQE